MKFYNLGHKTFETDFSCICKVCLRVAKMAAPKIESIPCNHSINAVLTGFNSTIQKIQVKFKAKLVNLQ